MIVIGLDCATEDSKIGLALGEYKAGFIEVSNVEVCSPERRVVSVVAEWLVGANQALLAIDAPLGWPVALAGALGDHKAGRPLGAKPNDMFRRETDRFVQREIGRTPLDVGADRIARTAHKALSILGELRKRIDAEVPLAWSFSSLAAIAAIEVYPAATLVAHGFRSGGYKKPSQVDERRQVISQLERVLRLPTDRSKVASNADALDAVVCLLAAKDFLDGRAMAPEDADLGSQEGWIWTASPGSRPAPNRRRGTRLVQ